MDYRLKNMAALTVPTIFTAVDKLSATVKRMQASVGGFAGKSSIAVNSLNKGLNSLLPSVGGLIKQFGALAFQAALFGGVAFSFKELADYEKAIQSFRRQLSDLDDGSFKPFQSQINAVAFATRRSAIDVAASFEAIALRNHDLAATADGMGKISSAGILLSKAANMEVTPATEALVNVLTLFKLGAGGSERAVNVMAAAMKYGSATISEMVDSLKTIGPVAVGANLTIEQTNALLGTLAKYQIKGEYAGTTLRTGIIRLQKAGLGYRNGLFDINDALNQATAIYDRLATAKKKDAFLNALFGMRGIIAGRVLLTNIPLFRKITQEITGTAEAHRMAAINTDNLINRVIELKNQWVNYITSNSKAAAGFQKLKEFIVLVTDNLDKIIDVIVTVVKWFMILKGAIWLTKIALGAYYVAMGVAAAVTGVANIALGESVVGLAAYRLATGLATAINYVFGTSIGKVTIATEAEAIAMKGVGTSAVTAAEGFTVAEGAATGFLAVIGRLLGPLGLLLIAYKNIGDIMDHIHDNEPILGPNGEGVHHNMTQAGILAANAAARAKVFGGHQSYVTPQGMRSFVPIRDMKADSMASALLPVLSSPSVAADTSAKNDPNIIHITVDDKGHIITGIKHNGVPINIPRSLHQTSTTGNK